MTIIKVPVWERLARGLWCIQLGKLANHRLHAAVSKGWTHLYLLKELTKFKTDTEMEFS